MALWGNKDNIESPGTVSLNYDTGVVTGSGTSFGLPGNQAREGNVIRFGQAFAAAADNFGDAVIVSIASSEELTILNADGLSGDAIANENYQISQSPKYLPADAANNPYDLATSYQVVGVATAGTDAAGGTSYQLTSAGWVGVTTYTDTNGNARVKTETFVAMSGIQTGNTPYPPS